MSVNRVYSFLGLARKSGNLVAGDALCEMMVSKRKAKLVLLAADASDRTRRKQEMLCQDHHVEVIRYGEKTEIGAILGRDAYAVVAITDEGFAARIKQLIRDNSPENTHGGGLIEQKDT